jgi:hypothetical protein
VFWSFFIFFKKVFGWCRARASKWEVLAPFERRVRSLPVAVGGFQRQRLNRQAALNTMGWRVLAFPARWSFDEKFSPPSYFLSPPPQKIWWPYKVAKRSSIF